MAKKMNLNMSLMKMVIKLLILLILIVMLFIVSAFLYSVKYWPDVYTYINANITIKRIPKISEIENITTTVKDSTELYETTDVYETTEMYTVDAFDIGDDYFSLEDVEDERKKRYIHIEEPKDYSEVPKTNVLVDYFFDIEDSRTETMNDLIDEDKLTTRDMKDVEMIPGGSYNIKGNLRHVCNMIFLNRIIFKPIALRKEILDFTII